MITRRSLLAAAGLAGCGRNLAKPFNGYAFVACRSDRLVAVVNLFRFKLSKQIALSGEPAEVLVKTGSARVFVLVPDLGTVVEIDGNTMSVARKFKVAGKAAAMRMAPDGEALWVLTKEPPALIDIDLKSSRVGVAIRLEKAASSFDLSQAAPFAVINANPSLVNLASRKVERPLEIDGTVNVIRFRPDGKQVLAGLRDTRLISIADAATGKLVVKLPMAFEPERFCFTRDNGGQLFVSGRGMDAVAIVSPYQTAVGETILAGRAPGAMAVDDNFLFVTNPESGDLSVITIQDRMMVAKIPVGQQPDAVLVLPDYVLVLNRKSGDVAVIRISKLSDLRGKRAPLFTVIPVGAEPVAGAIWAM